MIERLYKYLRGYIFGLIEQFQGARFRLVSRGICMSGNERRLLSLKNLYKNRRVFIIGNGPSLKKLDLQLLKNEITIGCNGLFLMFDDLGFLPTFYTVEDVLVAEDRADTINKIGGTQKVFPFDLKYCLKQDEETIYINFLRQYPEFPKFSMDFVNHVYWGGTVTLLNLQLAYYLGIREIYMIGVDYDYTVPDVDERKKFVITSHSPDLNHFHPDYFGPGYRYHDPLVDRMGKAYVEADKFFRNNSVKAFNATAGGKLEVFERVDYQTLF